MVLHAPSVWESRSLPESNFSIWPSAKPRAFVFDPDATSSDPQLRDTIVKYVFDFGDGTAPVATTEPTVDHQYAQGGQYGATLRVQDSRGKASAAEAVKQICEKCLK
jgi:PKD repeat protein